MSKKTAKNLFKDKTNVYVSECLSTNDFLTQLAKKNDLFEGSSVITDYQTHGRGQRKNKWESKKGENLLFSIFNCIIILNFYLIFCKMSIDNIYNFYT